ncbi:phosphoribosyltransferase-like protein [Kocuria subflava]|uniref:phosphoribosyltransferase-like protein n=1 Tax=Kocuria subflava TaxID=1736139 RepID=UPI003CC91CA0
MSIRPSQTKRGREWLTNFADSEQSTATLLLDSLQFVNATQVKDGLRSRIEEVGPRFRGEKCLLLPVLSIEDIDRQVECVKKYSRYTGSPFDASNEDPAGLSQDCRGYNTKTRHVAYLTFEPGVFIPATPGSEAAVASLLREFTGERPESNGYQWLHPASTLSELREHRCHVIVLATDYIGSGRQVLEFAATLARNPRLRSWRSFGRLKFVVVAYAASERGRRALNSARDVDATFIYRPAPSFRDAYWTPEERQAIEEMCLKYTPKRKKFEALGHKGSAGLFVAPDSVPNNIPYILRRVQSGWRHFFNNRSFPADLRHELNQYDPPLRDPARLATIANQQRLARALQSGDVRMPADRLIAVLALMNASAQTCESLTHQLGLPDDDIAAMLKFLERSGMITGSMTVTPRGRQEIHSARRLNRVSTAGLAGSMENYYPRTLRWGAEWGI